MLARLLRRSWLVAAVATMVLVAVQVVAARGTGGADGAGDLPTMGPSGPEVAIGAGAVVVLFLVLWLGVAVVRHLAAAREEPRR